VKIQVADHHYRLRAPDDVVGPTPQATGRPGLSRCDQRSSTRAKLEAGVDGTDSGLAALAAMPGHAQPLCAGVEIRASTMGPIDPFRVPSARGEQFWLRRAMAPDLGVLWGNPFSLLPREANADAPTADCWWIQLRDDIRLQQPVSPGRARQLISSQHPERRDGPEQTAWKATRAA